MQNTVLSKCCAALVARFHAPHCCSRWPSELVRGLQGRILVLGIRGGGCRVCHHDNTRGFFTILGASIILLWLCSRVIQRKTP